MISLRCGPWNRSGSAVDLEVDSVPESRLYLTVDELSARTGLSLSSLHRLKKQGRIPFFQPAGKGGRLLFPSRRP